MKPIKLSLVTALAAVGAMVVFSSPVLAQDEKEGKPPPKEGGGPGGPGGGRKGGQMSPQARLDRMSEQLSLTDEQKPKVKAVIEESSKKMQELRSDTSLAPEDRRPKMREIMDAEAKKMKEILTAEQYTKYEGMRQQMRGGGGPPGEKKGPAKQD